MEKELTTRYLIARRFQLPYRVGPLREGTAFRREVDQNTIGSLKSFSHPLDSDLHSLSYSIYYGDVTDMTQLLPQKEYSLMIAGIPYGFRLAVSINDEVLTIGVVSYL